MRLSIWVSVMCCLLIGSYAFGFNNQITAGIDYENWSSSYENNDNYEEEGDATTTGIFLGYTYYFTPLYNHDDRPLDLLPFFSKSSRVYGNVYTGSYKYDINASDSGNGWEWEQDQSREKSWTGFGLGGRYYLPSNTGIGGRVFTQDGKLDDKDKDDTNGFNRDDSYDEGQNGLTVSVDHYLSDYHNLAIKYSQTSRNREYEEYTDERDYSSQWYLLNYTGVLDQYSNIYISIDIGKGTRKEERSYNEDDTNRDDEDFKHDLTKLSVTAGPVYRNFAVYVSLSQTKYDPKDDDPWEWEAVATYFAVAPRYWFSEQLMVGCDLYHRTWKQSSEDPDSDWESDYDESGTGIEIKARYRF